MKYECIYQKDSCIECDICNVLELKAYPEAMADELSGLSGNDIIMYEYIKEDEIEDELCNIYNISRETLNKFLNGKYVKKVNNKPIRLTNIYETRNPINITIGFQDEPAGDEAEQVQNMGIMKIEMPKHDYETLFVIGGIVLLDLIKILEFNGIEMVGE